jgi:hypothetical protein
VVIVRISFAFVLPLLEHQHRAGSRGLLADLIGAFDWDPDIYGIRAAESCRARHFTSGT